MNYLVDFELPAMLDSNLFILIPSINRRIALMLNGEPFFGFESGALWTGPMIAVPVMVRLPNQEIVAGRNQLTVAVETGRFFGPRLSLPNLPWP